MKFSAIIQSVLLDFVVIANCSLFLPFDILLLTEDILLHLLEVVVVYLVAAVDGVPKREEGAVVANVVRVMERVISVVTCKRNESERRP